jgi:protein TonB
VHSNAELLKRLPREAELPRSARRTGEAPDAPDLRDSIDWFDQATASTSFEEPGVRLPDGDYLPILKVAPTYPSAALAKGLEGSVIIEFTVARSGAVKNVVVESTDSVFEQAAVEAAYRFKYRPRVVRGQAVEVPGVRNRITFDIPV